MSRAGVMLLVVLVAAPAASRPVPRLRAVVRVESAADRELLRRVRGYASDLERMVVEEASAGPLEPAVKEQVETASALARARNATAVIWFDHERLAPRAGVRVYVSQPQSDHLLVRRVEARRATSTSAVFEAAALIVQSSLRAIEDGKLLGAAPAEATATEPEPEEPAEEPAPPPPVAAAPVVAPVVTAAAAPASRWNWFVSVGAQWIADGQTSGGEFGGAGRFGVQSGALSLGLCAASMLPTELTDARATVLLSRHSVAGCGAWAGLRRETLSLSLEGQLGYAGFYRQTASTAAGVMASDPGLSSSLLVGGGLSGRWQLHPWWAITVAVGADFVPGSPTLRYDVAGRLDGARELWAVEPRAMVAVELGP